MVQLFPSLPFLAEETHWSWATRLAAFHIRGPVATFLRDLGLEPFTFLVGDHDEVARLCELAGQNPQPVLQSTLSRQKGNIHRLGEELLNKSLCPVENVRFCPTCLSEDDAKADRMGQHNSVHRHERLVWRLTPVSCCATHGRPLLCLPRPDGQRERGVFGDSVPRAGRVSREVECQSECHMTSPLQEYIAGRIAGQTGPIWLDRQPLEQSILSTQLLGAALGFGPLTFFSSRPDAPGTRGCGDHRLGSRCPGRERPPRCSPDPSGSGRAETNEAGTYYRDVRHPDERNASSSCICPARPLAAGAHR